MSDENIGCGFCSRKTRVLNAFQLKIGQHICEPGSNKLKYKERKHDLKAHYFHHAIIADIKERNDYQATLELIHYANVKGFKKGSIQKRKEKRDLKYDEIYIVEYKYLKYTPEEIVRRAESQLKEGIRNDTEETEGVQNETEETEKGVGIDTEKIKEGLYNDTEKTKGVENDSEKTEDVCITNNKEKIEDVGNGTDKTYKNVDNSENQSEDIESVFGNYNLFKSNCEHFATWCVIGKQESYQVDQKRKLLLFPLRVSSGAAGVFSIIILNILGLFAITSEKHSYDPAFPLLGVGGFYLLYLLRRFWKLKRLQNTKRVCSYCYEEKRYILVTKFMWFLVSGTLSYMTIWACIPLFPAWPVTILINVIFIILSACIQWLYKGLKSPFACKSIKVKQLSEVEQGEVVIFRYYGFQHFAIATKVTPNPNNSNSGKITVVHYNLVFPNTRVIAEEEIKWPEQTVWRLDLRKMTSFPPHQVISRIQSRLGEKKWHWHCNRSDHVCYWAVNKQSHWQFYITGANNETQIETKHEQKILSSLEVETAPVHMRNEIEIGDVVKFSVKNGNMKKGVGIVIQILDAGLDRDKAERIFQLSVVMQASKSITRSVINIDLNTDTLKARKFHPVHCHPLEERKKKALRALSDHMWDQKLKLIEFCVLKESRTSTDIEKLALERKKMT